MKLVVLLLTTTLMSAAAFADCPQVVSAQGYKVYSGEADEKLWSEDYARIEPCREQQLLVNFLEWATPKLGQFAELEKGLKDLATNSPYIIKHSKEGLKTKVFMGTVGGEDARWVYGNTDYYHPEKNKTGIAINYTEKFVQVLDFIDYLETNFKKNDKVSGFDVTAVTDALKIYLLGIHAHESRHGIDYKTRSARDLAYLLKHPDRNKWNGLVPREILENEVKVIVTDFEFTGFYLNFLYYKGHEDKLVYAAEFIKKWRQSKEHKAKFENFGFDDNGIQRNFSLLSETENNDIVSYYIMGDADITYGVPFPGKGEFSYKMVGTTIDAYMNSQYVPLEALWSLYDLNVKLHNDSKPDVEAYIKEFADIELKWLIYMGTEKTEFLLEVHELLVDVKARWEQEKQLFQANIKSKN